MIARFVRPFSRRGGGVSLGIGDDAALLAPTRGMRLVVTTDSVHAGVHFGPGFRAADIGHKALAVNLSDLAAMGARPRWFVVALALPRTITPWQVHGLARGMAALARLHGCALVGGNVAVTSALGLTVTALGEVPPRAALRRDRLRPGDIVAVTGALGGAAVGLRHLRAGSRRGAARQLRPTPRVAIGQAVRGRVRAAMDISDGLALDVTRFAAASGVGVDLSSRRIPLAPGASLQDGLGGGEDYELLLGIPPRHFAAVQRRIHRLGVPLTPIGLASRRGGIRLDDRRLPANGFDHFRRAARATPRPAEIW